MLYDVIIIGGGPAGLTNAIYCLRAGKKVLLIERMLPGGQVALTKHIKNYPGFEDVDGMDLSAKMFEQATKLGMEIVFSDVLDYNIEGKVKIIRTHEGTFEAKTIVLCLGASARELQLENEKKFLGKGVSYCATCDGNFFKDKVVAIVGGGNTAFEDVLYLANLVKKVYLIHRRDEFRGDKKTLDAIDEKCEGENAKIVKVLNSTVVGIGGENQLQNITIENKATSEQSILNVDGLFIAIGRKPDTDMVKDFVKVDEDGYILTDENMQTNIAGVYACGDVRKKHVRQIVTACADGAIAAYAINEYLHQN